MGAGSVFVYRSAFKKSIALLLVVFTPVLFAQNSGVAVLAGTGTVFLNGGQLSSSNAVVSGDVIQTQDNGTATVNGPGGSILIEPNSVVRFQGQGIALDRGQVSIATGKGFSVNARDFRITPVSNEWTQFYVTRTGGSINVIARKNDVTVTCGAAGAERVKEGKQISRDDADNCGLIAKGSGAPTAARGPILTSGAAKWTAVAVGGGLTIWALAQSDDPVSPAIP
jgi:ferric-dicitrate binding protein FerR (iron transport regulator)